MRRAEAPRAGWYPDPQSRTNLRYWDGLDWTNAWRSPPSAAELLSYEQREAAEAAHRYVAPPIESASQAGRGAQSWVASGDSQQIVDDVRRAARGEVDRAADLFSQRARQMQREIVPLVSEYTNRIVRWIRFAAVVAVVLLVAYFVFQVVAQASLFEWIGDRIDNFTDDQNGAAISLFAPLSLSA